MSQNDYVIANQTTPLFRADLNSALQALASNSSGVTAPTATYANMLWYDTATNILKMRSEADDAWINLGTLDQGANTFTPSIVNLILSQATWNTGTSTTEATITPEKLAGAIVAQVPDLIPSNTYELLSRTVISGSPATVDFTFDATLYDEIRFVLSNVRPSNNASQLWLRTSSNSGATYDTGAGDYAFILEAFSVNSTTLTDVGTQDSGESRIEISSPMSNGGGDEGISSTISVLGPNLAQNTGVSGSGSYRSSGILHTKFSVSGVRNSATDVNGVRFLFSTGTFASGTITMYGVRNS